MRLVKLDATSSTNDFLKELANHQETENFTVVSAESQTMGRGQMGTTWTSEKGKNLIMSVLIKECLSEISEIYNLNIAVALAVISALEKYDIPQLSIKWPNDIMAGNKKIGGILIENIIKSDGKIISIAGIGLNVNQLDFSQLPKASSLSLVMGRFFDREELLSRITTNIESHVNFIAEHSDILWQSYLLKLFKIGLPTPFEDVDGIRFMAVIENVARDGKLELLLEDDTRKSFAVKEVQMLY
jgi:BirA family biotin operon repressor/biotin-[acetyl-CoA-carboxylase] ligase